MDLVVTSQQWIANNVSHCTLKPTSQDAGLDFWKVIFLLKWLWIWWQTQGLCTQKVGYNTSSQEFLLDCRCKICGLEVSSSSDRPVSLLERLTSCSAYMQTLLYPTGSCQTRNKHLHFEKKWMELQWRPLLYCKEQLSGALQVCVSSWSLLFSNPQKWADRSTQQAHPLIHRYYACIGIDIFKYVLYIPPRSVSRY